MFQTQRDHVGVTIYVHQHLRVSCWKGFPTPDSARVLQDELNKSYAQSARQILLLNVVGGRSNDSGAFTPDVRKVFQEIFEEGNAHGGGVCHLIKMGGIFGSSVSLFLTTMGFVLTRKKTLKITSDVDAAIEWLLEKDAEGGGGLPAATELKAGLIDIIPRLAT